MAINVHSRDVKVCLLLVLLSKPDLGSQMSLFKCPILDAQWKQLLRKNLFNLCQENGQFPLKCISATGDLRSPLENIKGTFKNDIAIIATYEILQKVFFFVNKDLSYNALDSTCSKNLQNGLHLQIKELEKCMAAAKVEGNGLMNFNNMASYSLILEIKSYFRRMNDFLNVNQNSQCAWEIIRLEIKGCLISITQLLKKLK